MNQTVLSSGETSENSRVPSQGRGLSAGRERYGRSGVMVKMHHFRGQIISHFLFGPIPAAHLSSRCEKGLAYTASLSQQFPLNGSRDPTDKVQHWNLQGLSVVHENNQKYPKK